MISLEFLKSMESLSLYPEKSSEAISDQMDQSPPGGDLGSDGSAESENSNEQNNDLSLDSPDSSADVGMGMDDTGGLGGDGDSSGTNEGEKPMTLEPYENPFKVQNAKVTLDEMISELQHAVEDTLDKIHASETVDGEIIRRLQDLMDNVKKVRETVYVLPKESTMVKYRLCVKTYSAICDELCSKLKK